MVFAQAPAPASASPTLDFEFYRTRVEPMFLVKRPGNVRCVDCHGRGAGLLRFQPLAEGATAWSEEDSRKNLDALSKFIVPGSPRASRLLRHPLAREAGGDSFHGGGKHWHSATDPEYQTLVAWITGAIKPSGKTVVRIIQTNAAGDSAHLIDPATNKVVGVINDIEIPHGVTSAPDGSRIYISNEHRSTLDIVDSRSLSVIRRVPLSGRPNNVAVSKDGARVYVGIAQAPGALDVIDTASMTNVKTIPVKGAIHNVYVTPDGKYAVAGSIPASTISVVDTTTNELAWTIQMSAGIRPMIFERRSAACSSASIPNGSPSPPTASTSTLRPPATTRSSSWT